MLGSWLFSLLFIAVGTVVLASGIFTLLSNYKAGVNRVFFRTYGSDYDLVSRFGAVRHFAGCCNV